MASTRVAVNKETGMTETCFKKILRAGATVPLGSLPRLSGREKYVVHYKSLKYLHKFGAKITERL